MAGQYAAARCCHERAREDERRGQHDQRSGGQPRHGGTDGDPKHRRRQAKHAGEQKHGRHAVCPLPGGDGRNHHQRRDENSPRGGQPHDHHHGHQCHETKVDQCDRPARGRGKRRIEGDERRLLEGQHHGQHRDDRHRGQKHGVAGGERRGVSEQELLEAGAAGNPACRDPGNEGDAEPKRHAQHDRRGGVVPRAAKPAQQHQNTE